MNFDPENIPLVPNDWFKTQVNYEGRGRAEFRDPSGAIEGSTQIKTSESGTLSVEMDIERIESEYTLRLGLMELLSGQKPIEGSGRISIGGGGQQNRCVKLSVTTPQGQFSATDDIHYGHIISLPDCTSGKINFTLLRSKFDTAATGHSMYWVIPLTNFLSKFVTWHPTLNRHPLRIYPTPIVPDGLSEEDAFIAANNANLKNRLITFEFMGNSGFIEALPDYSAREESLRQGRERYAITALMIGEVGSNSIEQDSLKQWFPDDFLRLLSTATGISVGAPWVEFRNGRGELVRRVHVKLNQAPFSMGHRPLEEGIHSGTGYLLTKYRSSPHRNKPYLKVVLKHLFQAARYDQSIEDKFLYLARALENLCQQYGFKGQDLMNSLDPIGNRSSGEFLTLRQAKFVLRLGRPPVWANLTKAGRLIALPKERLERRAERRIVLDLRLLSCFSISLCPILKLLTHTTSMILAQMVYLHGAVCSLNIVVPPYIRVFSTSQKTSTTLMTS